GAAQAAFRERVAVAVDAAGGVAVEAVRVGGVQAGRERAVERVDDLAERVDERPGLAGAEAGLERVGEAARDEGGGAAVVEAVREAVAEAAGAVVVAAEAGADAVAVVGLVVGDRAVAGGVRGAEAVARVEAEGVGRVPAAGVRFLLALHEAFVEAGVHAVVEGLELAGGDAVGVALVVTDAVAVVVLGVGGLRRVVGLVVGGGVVRLGLAAREAGVAVFLRGAARAREAA